MPQEVNKLLGLSSGSHYIRIRPTSVIRDRVDKDIFAPLPGLVQEVELTVSLLITEGDHELAVVVDVPHLERDVHVVLIRIAIWRYA